MSAIVGLGISPKQMSRLRNGHKVRVKKGEGCNVIVNPKNYNIVSRAFRKNKGAEIQLSPEEIQMNASPEQAVASNEDLDMGLASLFGQGLFASGGKLSLKSISKAVKKGQDTYKKGMDTYKKGMDTYNKAQDLYSAVKNKDLKGVVSGVQDVYKSGNDAYKSGLSTKDSAIAVKDTAIGGKLRLGKMLKKGLSGIKQGVEIAKQAKDIGDYYQSSNPQTGMGLYASNVRGGYLGLQTAGLADYTKGRERLETLGLKRGDAPIKSYWDGSLDPPSRGSGVNMIRGRGSLLSTERGLPPALQDQPDGVNFHMQFQLPPQYQRGNVSGSGIFA